MEAEVAAIRRRLAPLAKGGPDYNRDVAVGLATIQARMRAGDFTGALALARGSDNALAHGAY